MFDVADINSRRQMPRPISDLLDTIDACRYLRSVTISRDSRQINGLPA